MRLFVAIGLPDEWKKTLAQPEASIGWLGRGVKWVEPRGMHLTLRFLGEVQENELGSIERALAEICDAYKPFEMKIRGTGVFPNAKRPRVYWAGLDAPKELLLMQGEIELAMQQLGFEPEEQQFKPHLTLARIKDPIGKDRMTSALLSFRISCEPITVREILLMQSHLSAEGARYEAIRRYALGAT